MQLVWIPVLGSTCSGGIPVWAGGGCPTMSLLYIYNPRLGWAPNNLPWTQQINSHMHRGAKKLH